MLNRNELRAEFARNGLRHGDIAKMLGISPRTLSERIKSGVFKTNEVEILMSKLKIENPMRVFFDR